MAFSMADYLDSGIADYTTTNLSIAPQDSMPVTPVINQEDIWTDDGNANTIEIDGGLAFILELNYNMLEPDDAKTVMDFYLDSTKANRKKNTFYFEHPTDDEIYVAKFISSPPTHNTLSVPTYESISTIKLLITAVKVGAVLLESGDGLLLESGDDLLMEEGS